MIVDLRDKMKPALRHIGAAVIGLAAVYGAYKALENTIVNHSPSNNNTQVIQEYKPTLEEKLQMREQSEESYAPAVQREPSPEEAKRLFEDYNHALKTALPMVNKADVIKAQLTSLNNDGYQDYVVLYYNGNSEINGVKPTNLEIFSKSIDNKSFKRDFTSNSIVVRNFEIRDLDNDGLLDVVEDTYVPLQGEGWLSIIKFQNGEYKSLQSVQYKRDIKIEDIDHDGIQEIISDGELVRWNGTYYRLMPGSIPTFKAESTLDERISEQMPNMPTQQLGQGYPQDYNQVTQRYLHGLNLVLKDSVNMLSVQENPLPYDPIVGANVNVSVRTRKNNETIIDETYYSDNKGIVNLRFPHLQHYKNDTLDICFDIERQPYDIITNACIDIEDLDPQSIKDGRVTRLSRPHLRRGESVGEFYVEKGKSEPGIGDLQDITLSLTMHMLDRYRYSDR